MNKFDNGALIVPPPKRPKKITGTRFSSILGLDKWNTPFKTWCAITKAYEDPFVDNVYTIAGKTIEPAIINYLNKVYFFGDLKTPTDIYGADYFKKTYGDFFKEVEIFGGMWDALVYDGKTPTTVIEIKTTKRAEDWADGKAPINYSLQAALYAHLLGIDDVVMVVAFLEEKDYEHPELFVPDSSNTITDDFQVSERFPDMDNLIKDCQEWWERHVLTGVSPMFDEKADADILKILRTNSVSADTDISALLIEAETLKADIEIIKSRELDDKEKRLKELTDAIKQSAIQNFRDGDKKVTFTGATLLWEISKSSTTGVNKDALKSDGLLEKYTTTTESYRITTKELKEDK